MLKANKKLEAFKKGELGSDGYGKVCLWATD